MIWVSSNIRNDVKYCCCKTFLDLMCSVLLLPMTTNIQITKADNIFSSNSYISYILRLNLFLAYFIIFDFQVLFPYSDYSFLFISSFEKDYSPWTICVSSLSCILSEFYFYFLMQKTTLGVNLTTPPPLVLEGLMKQIYHNINPCLS